MKKVDYGSGTSRVRGQAARVQRVRQVHLPTDRRVRSSATSRTRSDRIFPRERPRLRRIDHPKQQQQQHNNRLHSQQHDHQHSDRAQSQRSTAAAQLASSSTSPSSSSPRTQELIMIIIIIIFN